MITVEGLTKKYGSTVAVDDLSFTVEPGVVTGFLGPNGSGTGQLLCRILLVTRTTVVCLTSPLIRA